MNRTLPRLAAATALLLAVVSAAPAWAVTFEARVVASADDAEANSSNSMYLNSSDLELVVDPSSTIQTVGMRWTGITIPKGATITTAYVQFTAKEAQSEATSLTFNGQAADNAGTFTSLNGNLTPAVRPRTAAAVSWPNLDAWTQNAATTSQRTPDLKTIVQEIVNRNLWASGNALVLIVTGSGHRTAFSWDGGSAQAPLLHIEYTTGPPPNNAPVAGLAVTQPATPPLTVNANGSTSTDTDAFPIATYRFDFGDGTPTVTTNAPSATASHAYASPGPYTVTLTVTDTGNLTSTPVTRSITVQPENPPVASLTVTPVASPALTVLANGAGSTDGDLTPIATYRFTFGDGTATVTANAPTTTASHTYASPGTYTVTLVAVDTGGNASAPVTQGVTVELPDDPPVARLSVTQRAIPALTVDADGSASTDTDATPIASYHFDFGDGTATVTANAPTATASHVYGSAGTYTVTLIAIDTGGKTSAPATKSIVVQPENPPNASLVLSQPPLPALTVNANAGGSSDGDLTPIATYSFDFHDGPPVVTHPPTATASHTYSTSGSHSVTVIVTDSAGNASTPVTQTITVQADDPPVAALSLSQAASPFLTAIADGSGSTDGDLTPIASYRFDFGDGTTVTTFPPTATARHTYALPGPHTVTLVATDTGGQESAPVSKSVTIVAPPENPPVAHLTVTRAPVPALVVNADASASTDDDLTPIASYRFQFGDGTATVTATAPSATASHTYAAQGTYTVTLIVVDTGGFASAPVTQSILVQPPNQPPTAQLALSQPPTPARTVIADAAGSTDPDFMPIASYRFTWGDGTPTTTATAPTTTASHSYATPGSKTVTVVAVDAGGLESAPVSRTINVLQENPPTPQMTLTQPATPPRTVVADASASTDADLTPVATYQFAWGDGTPNTTTTAPSSTASHAYATAGAKTVTLVVTDTGGNASSPITRNITVVDEAAPVATLNVTQQSSPALTVLANAAGSTDGDLTPIATYRFTWGDGTPTVTANAPSTTASHTYGSAGTYTVTLIATDTGGFASAPVTRSVTVSANNPPVASLSVTQAASPALTVNASGAGSTDTDAWPIASYRFTWGDGTPTTTATAPSNSATHTYATAGTYTVTLIAVDTANLSSTPVSQSITVVQSGTVDKRIALGTDDAEQPGNGNVNLTSSDLELVQDAQLQTVGLRFTGINVPRSAVITNAWIQFDAKESQTETTALKIQGEAADNPGTFTNTSSNVSSRARTSSYATWSPVPSWTSTSGQGAGQRTPNLAFPVQQIVNRAGWNSGNAMVFVVTGSGHRTAYSYEGAAARAPLLHIEYGNGPPPPQQAPVASFTATPSVLAASVDASASTDGDLTPIATYRFQWGDGTTTTTTAPSATATHTYATAGPYTITLVATDTGNNASAPVTRTITVPAPTPPTARLTVTSNALVATASGSTSSAGTYPIATYRFTWGDGTATTTATAPSTTASHTYAAPNTYTVTLVVTDTQNLTSTATASITVSNTPTSGTIDKRVALGSDDAEQAASGSVSLTSSDIELVQDASTQTVGLRFTGINIPRNATISNAYIQFDAKEAQSEATNLNIRAEASDNAATFTTGTGNVSGRSKTSSYGTWTPVAWNATDGQGTNQRTPNLAFPIQQVVNRSGWNSGNALAFIITGTGHRTAYSFETSATRSALLHIDWGGAAPPQQAPVARLTVSAVGLTVTADGSSSTDGDLSPIASYRFQWGDGTSATTVNAPNASATHTYAVSGTYTVTLTATDTGGRVSSPVTSSITVTTGGGGGGSGVAVYAGYYSTHHPDNQRPKPAPWFGSPGIIFAGVPDDGVSSGWDTAAIRIDNLGTSGLSNVSVTCDIGSHHFALWSSQSIPAGGRLILAQTGYENFDGSDTSPAGCYDCDPNDCLTKVVSTIPVVHVTIGGTTTHYYDNAQTLNTEGVDAAGCPYTGGRNDESRVWVRIYPPGGAAANQTSAAAIDSSTAGSDSTDAVARALPLGPRLGWVRRPYPNPSRGRIELMFRLGTPGNVDIGMYDVTGRLVRQVSQVDLEAGDYLQQVNLTGMAPGMYYFTIATPDAKIRHPLVIVR